MKYKLVKTILNFCREIIFGSDRRIVKPLALDISKILHTLISIDQHRDHIPSADWLKLIETILQILNEQIKINLTDKFVVELLSTLRIFVLNPSIIIEDIAYDLTDFLANYFITMKKESSTTATVLDISNNLIIILSTSKIRHCLKLVKTVLKVAGALMTTNYESLRDQLLVFGLLSGNFICENLPKLIEVENSQDPSSSDDDGTRDDLIYWIDQWIQLILKNPLDMLSLSQIEHLNSKTEPSWFNFGRIRLQESADPRQWLTILALTSLIHSLHQLEMPHVRGSQAPSKKRKLGSVSFSALLASSHDPVHLCFQFISSHDVSLQQFGFQLLVFYVYNYEISTSDIQFAEVVAYYDTPSLADFASLLVISLLENGWELSDAELSQLIKINLQMLKSDNMVNVASQTILQVLTTPNFANSDHSLYLQIQSVFEISEINGPCNISNDTLKFWIIFAQQAKGFKSQNKNATERIIDWLLTKWKNVDFPRTSSLPAFISSLAGAKFDNLDGEEVYENSFNNFYAKWAQKSDLAKYILRISNTKPLAISPSVSLEDKGYTLEFGDVTPIVDQILNSLETFDGSSNGESLFSLVRFGHIIYQNIKDIQKLDSSTQRLKYDIRRYLETLDFQRFDDLTSVAFQLNKIKLINESGEFVFDCFSVEELSRTLIEHYQASADSHTSSNSAGAESSAILSDFGEFGEVRKQERESHIQESKSYLDLQCYSTVQQKVLQLMIGINSRFTYSKNINTTVDQAIRLLETLRVENFAAGLYTLLSYLEKVDVFKIQTVSISRLLRLLGGKLLSSYKYERSPTTIILASKFFMIFTQVWLMKTTESWAADYSDMFKWVVSLAERGLITEELSLFYFVKSIFVKLKHESDTLSQDVGIKLFHKSSNSSKTKLCDDLKGFIENLPLTDQVRALESICGGFINPQTLDDLAATYSYCVGQLLSISYPLFVTGVCQLLLNYGYLHFAPYIKETLKEILPTLVEEEIIMLEFLRFWLDARSDITTFPCRLFGFETQHEFTIRFKNLIYAALVSSKETPIYLITSNKVMGGSVDETDLSLETISLSLPLCYSKNGRRSEILKLVSETYDISLVEHQALLIVKRLLDMCDFSKESDFIKYIPSIENNDNFTKLFANSNAVKDVHHLMHVSVPFSIVLHQVKKLTSTESNFWTPASVQFLSRSTLQSLSKANHADEKLVCLRRLKLIIVLGSEGLVSEGVVLSIIDFIHPYIMDLAVHDEICRVIVTLVENYKSYIQDTERFYSIVIKVLHAMARYKKTNTVNNALENFLVIFLSSQNWKGIWKMLFVPLSHLLALNISALQKLLVLDYKPKYQRRTSYSEYVSIHELLHHTVAIKSDALKSLIFDVLATFFSEIKELNTANWDIMTNRQIAMMLSKSHSQGSHEFDLFKARYLGRHYTLTGETFSELNLEIKPTIEYSLDAKTSYLFEVMDHLLQLRQLSPNLEEVTLIEHVFSVSLLEHNRGMLNASPMVSFELHLQGLVKTLIPLDLFTFKIMYPDGYEVSDWSELSVDSGIETKSFTFWARDIVLSILQTFDSTPLIYALGTFIHRFPKVSRIIFHQIVLFYLHHGRSAEEKLVIKFIGNIFKGDDVSRLPQDHMKMILELCYYLGIDRSIKSFNNVFSSLDFKKVFQFASSCGMPKYALLMFEFYYQNIVFKNPSEWVGDAKILRDIYGQLQDEDLFYGLPVDPSLSYAMETLNRGDKNTWKSVIFNSANLDSSISLCSNSHTAVAESRNMMLNSLVSNSIYGIAELVNDAADPKRRLENSYEWCWKLNQWDLPASECPNTENEAIYNVLKSIHDNSEQKKLVCEKLLASSLNSKSNEKAIEKMRTLGALVNIEAVQALDQSNSLEEFNQYDKYTEKWFSLASFTEFENLMLARKVSYGQKALIPGSGNYLISQVLEMKRYGHFARIHKEIQRATNSSMWIDKKIQNEASQDLKQYLMKVSSFESACTLWSQGEVAIAIAMLKDNLQKQYAIPSEIIIANLEVHDSVLNAYLVKWSSESRQEKFETIMDTYVKASLKDIDSVSSNCEKANVYHILGYFCYKQTRLPGAEEEIERQEKLIRAKHAELKELKVILQNSETSNDEKKNAKRYYQRVQLQYESDKEMYNSTLNNRSICVEKALEFFLKAVAIDDVFDDEDIDKICALWLEYSEDEKINRIFRAKISSISSHKFIPWINQLVSRLSNDQSLFQEVLQRLLLSICLKHPFHSLYFIMNLRVHKLYQISRTDSTIHSRSSAADKLWNLLASNEPEFSKLIMDPVQTLSKRSLELATEKLSNNSIRKLNLKNLKIGDFWIKHIKGLDLPLPTNNQLKISVNGDYNSIPRIVSVDPTIQISASGISLPKIMKILLSDGSTQKMLLKGSTDDLRQDAIMEQVFEKVNTILKNDKETRKRDLKMRTYKVVPLGPQTGMIEFVAHSTALADILRPLHSDDSISFTEAREMMKQAQTKGTQARLGAYQKIVQATPPLFRYFFTDNFANIDDWFRSRQVYTRGTATNSIVGYILGLGDRHLNNILIDRRTGEPIHIDLGVAFDQGKLLPVPELVPFRLTRDTVDGLGITGVEGGFKKGSEHVFRVLRSNVEKIIGILNVLKYDPLYTWAISPIRKKRLQEIDNDNMTSRLNVEGDGSDAARAVKGVETKLKANGLSIEASVQELIQEATDSKNLGVIYLGWTPFY